MAAQSMYGYRKSKLATLHLVDVDYLRKELLAHKVTCEIPTCKRQATRIAPSGVAQFMCAPHSELYFSDPKIAIALDKAAMLGRQQIDAVTKSHAYEGADTLEVIVFDGTSSAINSVRGWPETVSKLAATQARVNAAALVSIPVRPVIVPSLDLVMPKVRPSIMTLERSMEFPGMKLFQSQDT